MTKRSTILWLFIFLKFVLQYCLVGSGYELHRDEYLHLDQAKHLAWGYQSVPPFTSWISYLILLLGNSVFWVKFFPALFGALTLVVVWKTIEELRGNLFALILGSIAVTFSAILRINILYQPNSFDILCWTVLYFTLIKFINSENSKWLWFASLAFAIGFLNKYNIAFLLLGILPAIILTEHRKVFTNRQLYFSAALAILIVSPNLIWQFQNDLPVLHHLAELAKTQLVNVNRMDFLKEQLLFFVNSIFIIITALISFFSYPPFKKYRFVFWSFLFTLSIFFYFKAKGYYAIGLYPVLLAFGAVYLQHLLQSGWKRYLQPVLILTIILLFIPVLRVAFPIYSPAEIQSRSQLYKDLGLLRWEDGQDHSLPQDFADMLGWKELAGKVDKAYDIIPNHSNTLVLCDNYGQAGAINYYSKHKDIQAVSFNADYINWFPLDKEIKNVILVKEMEDDDKNREEEKSYFDKISLSGKIENTFAREYGTSIYLLAESKVSINKILEEEINHRKNSRE